MGRRLVDELGPQHDGCHHTGDKADGADDDVEVGKVHLGPQVASKAEEDEAEREDEDSNSDNKVNGDHPHPWGRWSQLGPGSKRKRMLGIDRGGVDTCCGSHNC